MYRVFIVDDNEILRLGVTSLIDAQRDLAVVGECDSVAEAPAQIAEAGADVVVLDSELHDGSGIVLCRTVRSGRTPTRCLVFTADEANGTFAAAILAGASGYVLKRAPREAFVDALSRVAHGEQLLQTMSAAPSGGMPAASAAGSSAPALSPREEQVLQLIASGMTNRQIGQTLALAEKTVKNYVSGLLAKLGFERRTQAAVYGATHGHSALLGLRG